MCVVSNIGDHFRDRWGPYVVPPNEFRPHFTLAPEITRAEFEELKREVRECMDLIRKARDIDAALGNPDCEMEQKLAVVRAVANAVGFDLDEVLEDAGFTT